MADTSLDLLSKIGATGDMARNNAGMFHPSQDFGFTPDPNASTTPVGTNVPNITQELPRYRKTAVDKWNQIVPQLTNYGIPQAATKVVYQMDQQRLSAGQAPMTMDETTQALFAAKARHPITKVPDQGGSLTDLINPSNWLDDAENILGSIDKLPAAVVGAVEDIPKIRSKIAAAHGNLAKILTTTPVLNLVPGTHTAADVISGNWGDIEKHPLMTALDVLPALTKGAEMTPAGKLADETRIAEGSGGSIRPIKAAALYKVVDAPQLDSSLNPVLDETGNPVISKQLVPNPVGQQIHNFFNENPVGSELSSKFGNRARDLNAFVNRKQVGMARIFQGIGNLPDWAGEAGDIERQGAALNKQYDMNPTDQLAASRIGQTWDPGNSEQRAILDANPKYEDYLNDARTLANRTMDLVAPPVESILNSRGKVSADSTALLAKVNGEVYTPEQAQKLHAMERIAQQAESRLSTNWNRGRASSIVQRLGDLANTQGADPRIMDVADSIVKGDYKEAQQTFSKLGAKKIALGKSEIRATTSEANPNVLETELPGGQVQAREYKNIGNALDRAVDLRTKFENMKDTTPPARFGDWIVDQVGNELRAKLADNPAVNAEQLTHTIYMRDWQDLISKGLVDEQWLNDTARDVGRGWQQASDVGVDPIFFHHVQPSSVGSMAWPKILPQIGELSSARERGWSFQPYVPDYGVAISHQGMELSRLKAQEEAVDYVVKQFGVRESDLRARTETRAAKFGAANVLDEFGGNNRDAIMSKGFGKFDPEKQVGYRPARWQSLSGEDPIWLPKPVLKVIEDMRQPASDNLLTHITDPIMRPFRASVLTLSPRFAANTILGGAIMNAAYNPRGFIRILDAMKLVRGTATVEDLLGHDVGSASDDFDQSLNQSRNQQHDLNTLQSRAGFTLGKWFRQIQDGRFNNLADTAAKWWSKPLDIHNYFENLYRSMALLGGSDVGLKEGMTPEVAAQEGLRLAQRVLPQWESLTPFERGIVRSVFPFYTWTQHILSYVANFPLDHPTRVAVTSNLVRNHLNDEGSGWPTLFRSMLLLGHPDAAGNQTAVKLNGGNPFRDVSTLFTLKGFLAGMNPLLATAAQSIGIKEGSADLYPQYNYNASTGKPEMDTGSVLGNLLHNTIPQSDWIAQMLGANEDFESELHTNPDAAKRRALSDFAIPQFWGKINIDAEAAKQELTTYKAMLKDKSAGTKSGNLDQITQWPDQQAYAKQLEAMSPAQLAPYVPPYTTKASPAQTRQASQLQSNGLP